MNRIKKFFLKINNGIIIGVLFLVLVFLGACSKKINIQEKNDDVSNYKRSFDDSSGSGTSTGDKGNTQGTSVFDGSGSGIFTRQPLRRPAISDLKVDQSGKMRFKICIDRKGKTTFIDFISNGSTIRDQKAIKLTLDYLGRFVWEEDNEAELEQCGVYTIIIDNRRN